MFFLVLPSRPPRHARVAEGLVDPAGSLRMAFHTEKLKTQISDGDRPGL